MGNRANRAKDLGGEQPRVGVVPLWSSVASVGGELSWRGRSCGRRVEWCTVATL